MGTLLPKVRIVPRLFEGERYTDVFFLIEHESGIEYAYSRYNYDIPDSPEQRRQQAQAYIDRRTRFP
jgi:hypothetical protein